MNKKPSHPADTTPHQANANKVALQLDAQLCFALYATSLAMTKVYRPLLRALGLTYPQYLVMLALWQHGALSVGQLGEKVALDSGTLVPLIRKLSALELLNRHRSPADDRSVLISLTAQGAALQERTHTIHEQVSCTTQRSDAQRLALVSDLQTLRASLREAANTSSKAKPRCESDGTSNSFSNFAD